ncbi:MAG: hypothetical protein QOH84_5770, partial [Kribbellaceae bacterium]|nr:hypothetical protein [Kribbellaceae bacterium]
MTEVLVPVDDFLAVVAQVSSDA